MMVGMAGVYGIDKYKLEALASNRGIDLYKYDSFVEKYIDTILKSFRKKDQKIYRPFYKDGKMYQNRVGSV